MMRILNKRYLLPLEAVQGGVPVEAFGRVRGSKKQVVMGHPPEAIERLVSSKQGRISQAKREDSKAIMQQPSHPGYSSH